MKIRNAILTAAVAGLLAVTTAGAQNYLFPNGSGQVNFVLQIDPTSAEDATGISVIIDTSAAAPPSFLQLFPAGSQPNTIAIGDTGSYIFNYQVSQSPQSGPVTFGLVWPIIFLSYDRPRRRR